MEYRTHANPHKDRLLINIKPISGLDQISEAAGMLTDEGFIYVVDRKKDLLISGGENVYPAEIERVIREIPGIGDISIIGIPDDTWGQVPKAFIEIQPGTLIDAEVVIDHCRSKLAGYKAPKQVEFIEQLPRTPSGKVLKRKLRDWPADNH